MKQSQMKYIVSDNGWYEGETTVLVDNSKIEYGDFYLFIGEKFNPKKHLGWCQLENSKNKLAGSIELCDSESLSLRLNNKNYKKIIWSNKFLNSKDERTHITNSYILQIIQ